MAGKFAASHGQRPIGGSGRSIKGFPVVSDFETLLGQELKNSKTYLSLPERFVFQAIQANESIEEAEADLRRIACNAPDRTTTMTTVGTSPCSSTGCAGSAASAGSRASQASQGSQGSPRTWGL